jgi:hypothetical protein
MMWARAPRTSGSGTDTNEFRKPQAVELKRFEEYRLLAPPHEGALAAYID